MDRIPFHPYDFFGYLASGLLVVVGMQFVLGFPEVVGRDFGVVDTAILTLAIYIAGQIMATPAKAILEDVIVDKCLGRPHTNLLREKAPAVRGVLFPGFYKPLPADRRSRIVSKLEDERMDQKGEALFLYIRFHPNIRNDEHLKERLAGFLNQYGFNRNLAFTSVLVGTALLFVAPTSPEPQLITEYGLTAIVAGVLLFYRYLKFFRQYTYELFNTYAGTASQS